MTTRVDPSPSCSPEVQALKALVKEMRHYNDSDDGKRPCREFEERRPGADLCGSCGWPEHCHVIERWLDSLLAALAQQESGSSNP